MKPNRQDAPAAPRPSSTRFDSISRAYWPVDIRRNGPYTIKVLLNGEARSETKVNLSVVVGDHEMTQAFTVPRGVDSAAIGKITLPANGIGRIAARVENEIRRAPRVYQVTIK